MKNLKKLTSLLLALVLCLSLTAYGFSSRPDIWPDVEPDVGGTDWRTTGIWRSGGFSNSGGGRDSGSGGDFID